MTLIVLVSAGVPVAAATVGWFADLVRVTAISSASSNYA